MDLGIVRLPAPSGSFDEHILFTEPFVALLARFHAAAAQRSISLAKLADEPFILYKGQVRDTALTACRAAGF